MKFLKVIRWLACGLAIAAAGFGCDEDVVVGTCTPCADCPTPLQACELVNTLATCNGMNDPSFAASCVEKWKVPPEWLIECVESTGCDASLCADRETRVRCEHPIAFFDETAISECLAAKWGSTESFCSGKASLKVCGPSGGETTVDCDRFCGGAAGSAVCETVAGRDVCVCG